MKTADYAIRVLTVATFIALLFAPNTLGFPLLLFTFAAMGVWALLYPQGIIAWAKTAHPTLDPEDTDIWWIPRFIGGAFIALVLIAFALRWR